MTSFEHSDVTVVTAYYPLPKAKHSVASYMQWIQNLCLIPCSLVVYTDVETAEKIRQWRLGHPTHIEVRPYFSWRMTSPEMMTMWQQDYAMDPEKAYHSPDLYAMWALKQEVVRATIQSNPFQSQWFVWCDIGIQREPSLQNFYMSFPSKVPTLCPRGRMSFLEVNPIPERFVGAWRHRTPCPLPIPSVTLGGGCIVGDISAWEDFGSAYESTLLEIHQRHEFGGKDQAIFFRMLIDHKVQRPYCLFFAQRFSSHSGIDWMSFPVILGGSTIAKQDPRFNEV
jgi:hypothetical protein